MCTLVFSEILDCDKNLENQNSDFPDKVDFSDQLFAALKLAKRPKIFPK